jgi:hypothetical protein
MDRRRRLTRRQVLGSCSLAAVGLGGCASTPPDESGPVSSDTETERTVRETATATLTKTTGGDTTPTPELDLREANVVGVEFEAADGGIYDFHVTLYHDDDGEDGYANWWQVESLAGDRLGRRTLLHAHSTAPFTRSETVDVPGGTTCVVVRGHDQTHGYGGQAMLVNLDTGATRRHAQGSEPLAFGESDCP